MLRSRSNTTLCSRSRTRECHFASGRSGQSRCRSQTCWMCWLWSGQRGLVCQYDVVCFDEVSGISFDQKDGVNIMKGYMASGEFSRGKESIRAEGSMVMVGNFDVDVQQQQRIGHLLSPLPKEMRDDTAFHDRIHAYAPGWDFPKLNPNDHLTDHFGLVSDFLSECWSRLRQTSRMSVLQNR